MPKLDLTLASPLLDRRKGMASTCRADRKPFHIPTPWAASLLLCALFLGLGLGDKLHAQGKETEKAPPNGSQSQATNLENWEKATIFLFDEAHENFAKAAALSQGEEAAASRLGEGVTLLTIQPRTQGNLARSQSIFEELIAKNPKDATGLAARLYLARFYEFHVSPQAPEKAKEIYEGLLTDGLGDPLAELAASRLALIDLYSADSPESLNDAARKLAVHGTKLQTSIGRRELYSNLGLTLNELRGDKTLAMEYLIAAEAEDLPMQQLDAPLLITIAALAEELGDMETAKKYYSLFTSRYKRDTRRYSVLKKLEKLGGTDAGPAPTHPAPEAAPAPQAQPQS